MDMAAFTFMENLAAHIPISMSVSAGAGERWENLRNVSYFLVTELGKWHITYPVITLWIAIMCAKISADGLRPYGVDEASIPIPRRQRSLMHLRVFEPQSYMPILKDDVALAIQFLKDYTGAAECENLDVNASMLDVLLLLKDIKAILELPDPRA